MFSEKKDKSPKIIGNQQNRITEGTHITGDVVSKSGMRIDGSVDGTIKTPSKVVLGETGHIQGTLECENADIEGKFSGKMTISGTLTLKSTAHVEGDVVAGQLAVEPGAAFNATCVMKGAVKAMPKREEATEDLKSKNHSFERTGTKEKERKESN